MLESVPRGTLFVLPGQPGAYIDGPMTEEVASLFLQELSKDRHGSFNGQSATTIIQALIKSHGLVVVHKEDQENVQSDSIDVDPIGNRFRLATGGLMDVENVKAFVENGRIKPDTGLTVVDTSGHVVGPVKAKSISCIRALFNDFDDEPVVPSYTIVASSMQAIAKCYSQIVDQFGLKDTDSVALSRNYGDDSTESVVKAGGLHA